MMTVLHATVPGEPVGKGRPKFTTVGGFGRAYTPKKTATWEREAAKVLRAGYEFKDALAEPVAVEVDAVSSRPKRLLRKKDPDDRLWRTEKPDIDNVVKAALDALQQAGVLSDDKFVVSLRARSLYVARGEEPHVEIRVFTMNV